MNKNHISVVSSIFNNENKIDLFYNRLLKAIEKITQNYELVFVDDGSSDQSLKKITNFAKENKRLKIIKLSRNFGHHKAVKCGLDHASGDYIFLLDSDLDENPEWIEIFYQNIINSNKELVYGYETQRQGSFFNKIFGSVWWKIKNKLSNKNFNSNQITARIMTKKYLENLKRFNSLDVVLAILFVKNGFDQKGIELKKNTGSKSTYKFLKKVKLFFLPIFFNTKFFIYATFFFGTFFLIISFFILLFVLLQKYLFGNPVPGWASIVISIWFIGSILTYFCMIILVYLIRIRNYLENDPAYIIDEKINF